VAREIEKAEASPDRVGEWLKLRNTLGDELLAGLLGIRPARLRAYAFGHATTPEVVTARLRELTDIAYNLSGAFNNFGMQRWFARPRKAFSGESPASLLGAMWDPEGPAIDRVRNLAASPNSPTS